MEKNDETSSEDFEVFLNEIRSFTGLNDIGTLKFLKINVEDTSRFLRWTEDE